MVTPAESRCSVRVPYATSLLALPAFRGCNGREGTRLARELESVDVPRPGTVFVREGARADALWIIVEGTALVTVGAEPLGCLARGDCFTTAALLERRPARSTVAALTAMRLLACDARRFRVLIADVPRFALNLIEDLAACACELPSTQPGISAADAAGAATTWG